MGILHTYVFGREPGVLGFLDKKTHSEAYYSWRDGNAALMDTLNHREYTLTTPKGEKLKGFYYPAGDEPSDKIVFIIHGYRSNHAETAGMFRDFYHQRGIDIFTVDNPAAGQSEGDLVTFDYYESEAALLWLEFLLMTFGENIEIFLHGFSLGGGTVLMMSDRVPENVRFIIDDCGISGAPDLLKNQLGILYTPLNVINLVKHNFRFSLSMTDVRPHLAKAKCPILFVHGEKDKTVPFSTGREMYSLCPTYKDKLFVPEAAHMECIWFRPGSYGQKVDQFIEYFC